jgi:large subunit ribosomal protein L46
VILSRPPQITRDLHPFEKAFFLYQRRLNERLALPFTRYFYYAKGTPKFVDFQKKIKARKTAARDIGLYEAYGQHKWNDEAIVGAPESEPEHQLEALLKDERPWKDENEPAKATEELEEAIYIKPEPRETEADKTGDEKSLNRLLQRTLYLMVQDKSGNWRFPTTVLNSKEHESLRAVCNFPRWSRI